MPEKGSRKAWKNENKVGKITPNLDLLLQQEAWEQEANTEAEEENNFRHAHKQVEGRQEQQLWEKGKVQLITQASPASRIYSTFYGAKQEVSGVKQDELHWDKKAE